MEKKLRNRCIIDWAVCIINYQADTDLMPSVLTNLKPTLLLRVVSFGIYTTESYVPIFHSFEAGILKKNIPKMKLSHN